MVAGTAANCGSDLGVRVRVLTLLLLLPSLCFADDWTREDSYRQAALTALLIADWGQTRWIVKHPQNQIQSCASQVPCSRAYESRSESNHLLGEHPSIGKVNNYFSAFAVGHAAISYLMPPAWRQGWQYIFIGTEFDAVLGNRSMGVKMEF